MKLKRSIVVQMPGIEKTILRRDSEGLRKALCEKRASPEDSKSSDNHYQSSLLHLAEGWGDGINILLEFGADASQYFAELHTPGEEYHNSTALLLRAGCFFDREMMEQSYSQHDKGKRMHLFINELKSRREKLRTLAETFLPSHMIPAGNSLLDGPNCIRVYEMLASRTKDSPHSVAPREFFFLNKDICSESVYHNLKEVKCAEALYEAGFRATFMPDLNGNSPLGTMTMISPSSVVEIVQWHISKGSNIHQQLPWADESVAHLLISTTLLKLPLYSRVRDKSLFRICEHTKEHVDKLEKRLNHFNTIRKALFQLPDVPDGCSCLCSPGRLTAASLMSRELITSDVFVTHCHSCLWHVVTQFLEWDASYGENPLTFIRALTFNALDLTHTCFNKTKKGYIRFRNHEPDNEDFINDNSDEPSEIEEFETLQAELEQKFNELGLPLKEFVFKHWYIIVKDHLLTPPTPDEKYIADTRKVGVDLEQWEPSVPEWMTILFAPKVEEVDDKED